MINNSQIKNLKLEFDIGQMPFYTAAVSDGRKTLEIQGEDGVLTVSVRYDFNKIPLNLRGAIAQGDKAEIVLYDYRIELYINGKIVDEEWPAGNRLFSPDDCFFAGTKIRVNEITEKKVNLPSVISTFENAEGWYPGNGVFVGDCMPYQRNGEYHILYLKDRRHHGSKWGLGAHQWEHISTDDLKTWKVHPTAVPITESWEGSICTGSWIRRENTEYLYYTVRRAD